ncbi:MULTISPECIES: hypothetical protein [unclassified Variovorax]|uniref:hypothetical protein n=1 Tax=unclassified Variovorax TaxID=663243 RepID=UPI00076D89F8|nr:MULTISPECIES: hypothetical protein [unclassified Variovorax]KWT98275.1 hypothetical protein APY03_0410 [Variovorax sp. WDL1]PNG50070.1 hypothetical protein CHC06_05653 [Variovorax sp. B2]PNG50942.1 hypothetical protein CHC07_05558 [Variovorax sp. B4]VTU41674.1 hypothetical protein SRS16P1_00066 [Variovorax sp. SRS16]VTU41713.1 hypothetical protein E5P1_00066 [Variovorax sp. PBL-E5]
MHIAEKQTFERMVEMEGDAWRKAQLANPNQRYGFHVLLTAWQELQALDPLEPAAGIRDIVAEPVIYGEGGYHRYVVSDQGEVRFSKMHARQVNVEKAVALGFSLT